ncbi:uncharacterized protein LOC127812247 [Diospyros lotus]|uniref:uncharacterized protein LOC127812247 n=1 Tax=Diospyros lotus TaxID=55363 RepID=UPI002252958D|nr:uncharacterized protein LOC127812247 [Diospyros lotus]
MLSGGEDSSAFSLPLIAHTAADASSLNAQTQSLLSVAEEKYLLHYPMAPAVEPAPSFGFFVEEVLAGQSKAAEWPKPVDFFSEKLKMPKREPFNYEDVGSVSTEPFNFMYGGSDLSVSRFCAWRFQQLPDLRSLEQLQEGFGFAESSRKRGKSFSLMSNDEMTIDAMVGNIRSSNDFVSSRSPEIRTPRLPPAVAVPASVMARQRRQRISDKYRCLQKLLPWDRKMDIATMLEEAYKYVRFLKAQISVLQSMPCDSSSFATQNTWDAKVFGGLGRLNRQQLLQILVNSPVVQTVLYSKGCCVYSIEQMLLLKNIAERKALYQQLMFDPSTSS